MVLKKRREVGRNHKQGKTSRTKTKGAFGTVKASYLDLISFFSVRKN